MPTLPKCVVCGSAIEQRAKETGREFRQRKTCSPVCLLAKLSQQRGAATETVAAYRQMILEQHAPCLICADRLEYRKDEGAKHLVKRKTCSERCAKEQRRRASAAASKVALETASEGYWAVEAGPIDYGAGFGAHNLVLKPHYGRPPSRPDRGSGVGCSSALLVE